MDNIQIRKQAKGLTLFHSFYFLNTIFNLINGRLRCNSNVLKFAFVRQVLGNVRKFGVLKLILVDFGHIPLSPPPKKRDVVYVSFVFEV